MEEELVSDGFWDAMIERDRQRRASAAGQVALAAAQPEGDGSEEAYWRLMDVMVNKPVQKEALRRVLELCRAPQTIDAVETAIVGYPEYPLIMQPPYRLIKYLIDGGGLVQFELDDGGNVITDERKVTLGRDELDDLIVSFRLQTTEVGKALADDIAPFVRMKEVFQAYADRIPLFVDLLRFCCEPRTYVAIEGLIGPERIEGLKTYNFEPGVMMKPSVFVDNMEQAGALVWLDHAWHTTDEGKQLLEALPGKGA